MATKKFVLKSDIAKFNDGTNNEEHIKDIISEIEISYSNIQDNNDICIQLFKTREENVDKDLLDALQVACENMIELEKQATEVFNVADEVKKNLSKIDKSSQLDLEKLLKQMNGYEKKSEKIMKSVLKI